MFWIILIVAIAIGVWAYTSHSKGSHYTGKNTAPGYNNPETIAPTDTVKINIEPSSQERKDYSLILYETIQQFFGAIRDIRQDTGKRSPSLWGQIEIQREPDNTGAHYSVYGSYDHDGNYGVYDALRNHGDLSYFGLKVVEDGFVLKVDFHSSFDQTLYFNMNFIIDVMKHDIPDAIVTGMNDPATVEANAPDSKKNYLYLKFGFEDK